MKKPRVSAPKKAVESQKNEDGSAITVTLRPIRGIAPTTYLPVVYSIAIVLVLVGVFLVPGLVNRGTRITFSTLPDGASVYVDGVRIGSSPIESFVSSGTRTITVKKPFFADHERVVEVGGRVAASLFFPSRRTIDARLHPSDTRAMLEEAVLEYSRWSGVAFATAQSQFPPVVSWAVRDFHTGYGSDGANAVPEAFFDAVLGHTVSVDTLRDALRAVFIDSSRGGAFTPASGLDVVSRLAEYYRDEDGFLEHIAAVAPASLVADDAPWYAEYLADRRTRIIASVLAAELEVEVGDRVAVAGQWFRPVAPAQFVFGFRDDAQSAETSIPVVRRTGSFLVAESPVTRGMYREFVAENPTWARENASALVADGLVTDEYLAWLGDGRSDALPVTHVSYAAAREYAAWFSDRTAGYTARLPREHEWEVAARVNESDLYPGAFREVVTDGPVAVGGFGAGAAGLFDMLGNVWEWTDDRYLPAVHALSSDALERAQQYPAAHRVVRGGSWANRSNGVSVTTRGLQPQDWATPFIGFRVVLERSM
ncbi:MAG: PEGA domain-containing protein [Spirochaetaceae bacterium]|nr:MAG: PEGA domain-containing protein [Spirochaetaceae bacterium]